MQLGKARLPGNVGNEVEDQFGPFLVGEMTDPCKALHTGIGHDALDSYSGRRTDRLVPIRRCQYQWRL